MAAEGTVKSWLLVSEGGDDSALYEVMGKCVKSLVVWMGYLIFLVVLKHRMKINTSWITELHKTICILPLSSTNTCFFVDVLILFVVNLTKKRVVFFC